MTTKKTKTTEMEATLLTEPQRESLFATINYIRASLKYLSKHYPIVFAFVSIVYLRMINLDYMNMSRIDDCDLLCQPDKPEEQKNDFSLDLAVQLALLTDEECFLQTSASPSPLHVYSQQPQAMKCLTETNDCDVLVSFPAADLSSIPLATDLKYWQPSVNPESGSDHEKYKIASMLRTQDLVAHLQSHALNMTRSVKYLLKGKFANQNDYVWIYPTIRVPHMTRSLLERLEAMQELQSLEMTDFVVEYTAADPGSTSGVFHTSPSDPLNNVYPDSPFERSDCTLNSSVCANCYFENNVTKSPCKQPGDAGFTKINCQEALNNNVSFNCHLMRVDGNLFCNDAVLPQFDNCEVPLTLNIGHAEMVKVPGLDKVEAPDYLVYLLDSIASEFLNRPEGSGVPVPVIASFDSGVDYTHRLVRDSYRGFTGGVLSHRDNWYPHPEHPFPVDIRGHGTKALGVALGGYMDKDRDIYNAYGAAARYAQWIAASCDSGNPNKHQSQLCYMQVFQWLLSLAKKGKGADIILMPIKSDEAENSFIALYNAMDTLRNTSLIVTGLGRPKITDNLSTWCNSMSNPAAFANVITVGAITNNLRHSTLNPAGGFAKETVDGKSRSNTEIIKPDLVTFGEGIISAADEKDSVQHGLGGTSLSAGLVAGVLAQLKAAYPDMLLANYRAAMTSSCIPVPLPLSNVGNPNCPINDLNMRKYFGAGMLNATALDIELAAKSLVKKRPSKRRYH